MTRWASSRRRWPSEPGGRIKVDVHIANALAKGEAAHLEGVQLGTIDVAAIGSAPVGGMFEPSYQALDLPFLWATREQVWKVMDGPLGQELLKKMEAKNLKAFCFGGGWGFRNMMSSASSCLPSGSASSSPVASPRCPATAPPAR
ncbi:MAG TPA: TRAP transporter substrate-binding protein DctP [Methylomirabilota bacterium]|jgi:TRAP-type C4-dicarboxylate transport system substrate-binding protein